MPLPLTEWRRGTGDEGGGGLGFTVVATRSTGGRRRRECGSLVDEAGELWPPGQRMISGGGGGGTGPC